MGAYKYMREVWKRPKESLGEVWKERLIEWRKEPNSVRIERPTRLDRARSLGYKAKGGIIIVRQKVRRNKRMRPLNVSGRRPKAYRHKKITNMNYKEIAERRAGEHYPNCEVLNSYYVAEDGKYRWYEILLVDITHPQIVTDKNLNWLCIKKNRAKRGLTSSGKKSRGLRTKGKGSEKARPSANAVYKRKVNKR